MEMTTDILSLAAIVAAYVGVAKNYGIKPQHNNAIAIGVAAVFVLLPQVIADKLTLISLIGLTATGTYQYAKNAVLKRKGTE